MNIREINKQELPSLLELYKHLHGSDEPAPHEIAADTWESICSDKNLVYFGLYSNDRLVTSCTVAIIPNLTRGCRPYGLIENVVTHSDHRRKGFGKAILNAALKHAWKKNCYKVMLLTGRKDEATLSFYESAGFNANEKVAFVAKPETHNH